ncbi:TonB-dependent receptor, partial [Flavobacteriaceae bacterium]|nr:TonB-dependent receptor [Flavobacteriaceae bacterium]
EMEGKRLPGIPNSQAFIQVEYTTSSQWRFQLTGEHIGKFYANDSNTAAVDANQRVRLQARKGISFAWGEVAVFGGVHNLFNTFYFDTKKKLIDTVVQANKKKDAEINKPNK